MKKSFVLLLIFLLVPFNVFAENVIYEKNVLVKSYQNGTVVTSKKTGVINSTKSYKTSAYIPKNLTVYSYANIPVSRNALIDNRVFANVSLFPFSTIGIVETVFYDSNGNTVGGGYGSGVLIGPDLVLTAAHVIFDSNYGWAQEIKFSPSRTSFSDGGALYTANASEASIPQTFVDENKDDWALIEIDQSFSNLGYMGFELIDEYFVQMNMCSSGYSGDKNGQQWYTCGTVSAVGNLYDEGNTMMNVNGFYTFDGHSGAPIYGPDNNVYGVYSFGIDGGGGGVGIDEPLYDILYEELLESLFRNE